MAGIKALRRAKSGQPTLLPGVAEVRAVKKETGKSATPMRAAPEGSLAWLRRRRDKDGLPLITEPQFSAGERLGADFWHAQLTASGDRRLVGNRVPADARAVLLPAPASRWAITWWRRASASAGRWTP
jgi:hypothetical protein